MKFKNDITMLIFSCDKFSDLWNTHVELLEQYWKDRGIRTIIVTDKDSDANFDNVEVFCAGASLEFSERLNSVLGQITTKYIFVTLDDYFLIKNVDSNNIEYLYNIMEKENIQYMRLFPNPRRATAKKMNNYNGIYWINTSDTYSVNLYAGIWTKDFMQQTIKEVMNPWQYEVSLFKTATELNARCAVSKNNEFIILDVVRKGKILYSADKYLKKHDIKLETKREVHSLKYQILEDTRGFILVHMPKKLYYFARRIFIMFGMHSYSSEE